MEATGPHGAMSASNVPDITVSIRDVAAAPWSDAERVFGTRGDPARCWCQWYKLTSSEWSATEAAACRARFAESVGESSPSRPSPGILAYLGDEPVGWAAVEPRVRYPTALRGTVVSRGSTEAASDGSVWAVVCFVVRVGFRRRGIATALLAGAVDHARFHGARVLEGYPIDVSRLQRRANKSVTSAELYHGTLGLFESAGFEIAARPTPSRVVARLVL